MNRVTLMLAACVGLRTIGFSIGGEDYVAFTPVQGGFPLSANGRCAPLYAAPGEYPGVLRALRLFAGDIGR
ncbi:MAG TPA: hypothetical protein VML00_09940, partial [Bacteroidota bacterium]|nr:hypothetical protein [Bacteroidota bacterium]